MTPPSFGSSTLVSPLGLFFPLIFLVCYSVRHRQVIEQLDQEDKLVLLSGVNLSVSALILKANWFLQMVSDGKVFATYMDALASVEGEDDDIELTKIVNVQNF
jgi:hypothetical protein